MPFSLDTNLILGLLSENDRLHKESDRVFKIFHFNRREPFVCSLSALKETKRTLLTKINKVLVDLYPVIPKLIKISDSSSPKFTATFLGMLNALNKKNPSYSNFYKLVYKETMDFLKEGKTKDIPNFFSALAMELSGSVEWGLEERAPEAEIIGIKYNHMDEVMKIIGVLAEEKIRFKDSSDGEIFYEIVVYSKELSRIIFLSDDRAFIDKARVAKTASIKLSYNGSKFSFEHISEIEN